MTDAIGPAVTWNVQSDGRIDGSLDDFANAVTGNAPNHPHVVQLGEWTQPGTYDLPHGTLTVERDGVTGHYVPKAGQGGQQDTLHYVLKDDVGNSMNGTITIDIHKSSAEIAADQQKATAAEVAAHPPLTDPTKGSSQSPYTYDPKNPAEYDKVKAQIAANVQAAGAAMHAATLNQSGGGAPLHGNTLDYGTVKAGKDLVATGPQPLAGIGGAIDNAAFDHSTQKWVGFKNDQGEAKGPGTYQLHNGTLTIDNNLAANFRANDNVIGRHTETFDYTVADAAGHMGAGTIKFDVIGHSQANNDIYAATAGVAVPIDTAAIMSNDIAGDGGAKTFVGFDTAAGGRTEKGTISADGKTYTPDATATGMDTVTYNMTDASGNTSKGTIAINIAAKAQPSPTPTPGPIVPNPNTIVPNPNTIAPNAQVTDITGRFVAGGVTNLVEQIRSELKNGGLTDERRTNLLNTAKSLIDEANQAGFGGAIRTLEYRGTPTRDAATAYLNERLSSLTSDTVGAIGDSNFTADEIKNVVGDLSGLVDALGRKELSMPQQDPFYAGLTDRLNNASGNGGGQVDMVALGDRYKNLFAQTAYNAGAPFGTTFQPGSGYGQHYGSQGGGNVVAYDAGTNTNGAYQNMNQGQGYASPVVINNGGYQGQGYANAWNSGYSNPYPSDSWSSGQATNPYYSNPYASDGWSSGQATNPYYGAKRTA